MTKTSIIGLDLAKRVRTRQAHYAEATTLDGHGHPVADLSRLNLVEPDHAAP